MDELVYPQLLAPAARQYADKLAFVDGDYSATLAEHFMRVVRLGNAMRDDLRIAPHDHFGVLATGGHRYAELWHAGFMGAGVITPLNWRLAPEELAFVLNDSGVSIVFVERAFVPVLGTIRSELDSLRDIVLLDEAYEELLTGAGAAPLPSPSEDAPVVLMYTGGTTGRPKGVLHTQRAQMLSLYRILIEAPIKNRDVVLHFNPMFHRSAAPALLLVPARGATSILLPQFDSAAITAAIEEHQVTQTMMVPTAIRIWLDDPEFTPERVASLRTLIYGASPMPTPLLERLRATLPDVELYQFYGMTETGPISVLGPRDHTAEHLTSAGLPAAGVDLEIRMMDGQQAPTGESGEICVRTGSVMREYWQRPAPSRDVFADGVFHTGDIGYRDEEGFVYLVDRKNDMIITGGENVYSTEVENVISAHPAIAQVAVIGIPHELWGEAVHAVVVPKPGASVEEAAVVAFARERLAGYKVPKSVEIRTQPLELSAAMKPLKRELRKPYWEGRARDVG